ncbi:unnamed protein product [Gongylonema pulchrum]|uniref:Uncharacterized protein n=1 Tax=Gongylonema pulchrum TaxID=637853 RepID=A0A183ELM9_9BILA|nr:unnamed protein product [Gongylonema pulchrum]
MPRRKLSVTQRQISLERQRQLATERKRRYRSCESYRQAERVRDAVAHRLLRSRPVSTISVEDASDEPSTSRSLQQTVSGKERELQMSKLYDIVDEQALNTRKGKGLQTLKLCDNVDRRTLNTKKWKELQMLTPTNGR